MNVWHYSNSMTQNPTFAYISLTHKPTMSYSNHGSTAEDHYSGDGTNSFYKMGQHTADMSNAHTAGVQGHTMDYPPPEHANRDGGLPSPHPPSTKYDGYSFGRSFQSNPEAMHHLQFNHTHPVGSSPSNSAMMPTTNYRSNTPNTRGNYFTQPYTDQSAVISQPREESQPQLGSIKQGHSIRPISPGLYPPTGAGGIVAYPAQNVMSAMPSNSSGFPSPAYQQHRNVAQQQQQHQHYHSEQHVPHSIYPPSANNAYSPPPSAVHSHSNKPIYPPSHQTQPAPKQPPVPYAVPMYSDSRGPSEANASPRQSFGYGQHHHQQQQPAQTDPASTLPRTPSVHGPGGSRAPANTAVPGGRPVSQMSSTPGYEAYTSSHSSSLQNRHPTVSSVPVPSTHSNSAPVPYTRPNTATEPIRSPGSPSTRLEWDSVKNPIALLHESNILPSDGSDLPPRPGIDVPVNCDPDIMRCTLSNMPSTSTLLKACRLPLGLVIHPFRDIAKPCVINSPRIERCRSCRTYINPFVQLNDSGRRWRCITCFTTNQSDESFHYDPVTRKYRDLTLRSASVEYIAPSEYLQRPPQPATYLFCFDVSRNAVATGYLHFVCNELAALLTKIPGDSRRRIGFLTFNSSVHFYKMCGDSMKMIVCPDVSEPFLPDFEGLINLVEGTVDTVREFLRQLPDLFADTDDVENCLGVTLQIGLTLTRNSGGRITVFNTCLPTVGMGSLERRELTTDGISPAINHMGPAIDFYKSLGLECASMQVAVDMFILNSQYSDIATLSGVCRSSSGCLYHYPDFLYDPADCQKGVGGLTHEGPGEETAAGSPPISSNDLRRQELKVSGRVELERLRRDLTRYLTRRIGFEAVMRIRCTQGLSIQAFHGSSFVRSIDLLSLPNVSPDAGFAVQLEMSESLEAYNYVCLQAALLYTNSTGDRRIRVHTLCLPVVQTESLVFMGADPAAIACLLGKMAVDKATSAGLDVAREGLVNAVVDPLSAYASRCLKITPAYSSTHCGIVCPPNLRLLPLYVLGLLHYRAFSTSTVRLDDRSAAFERVKTAPPEELIAIFYPRLYAVHNIVTRPIAPSDATLAQKADTALSLAADQGDARTTCRRGRDRHEGDNEGQEVDDGSSSSSGDDREGEGEQQQWEDKLANGMEYSADKLPGQLHLSDKSIDTLGVYLLDTGELLMLLVGSDVNGRLHPSDVFRHNEAGAAAVTTLKQLLGVASPEELPQQCGPFAPPCLSPSGEPHSAGVPVARRRLCALIALLRRRRPTNSALVWMRHDAASCLRYRFLAGLVEDEAVSSPSYQDFLKKIQMAMKD